jgi:hypothetical protein
VAYEIVALFKIVWRIVLSRLDVFCCRASSDRECCAASFASAIFKNNVFFNWGLLNVMVPRHLQLATAVDAATTTAVLP